MAKVNEKLYNLTDICDTCAFCDACPSAHFHPTGRNECADYRSVLNDGGQAPQRED